MSSNHPESEFFYISYLDGRAVTWDRLPPPKWNYYTHKMTLLLFLAGRSFRCGINATSLLRSFPLSAETNEVICDDRINPRLFVEIRQPIDLNARIPSIVSKVQDMIDRLLAMEHIEGSK